MFLQLETDLDQEEALDFYVGTIGLEVGFVRWPTVSVLSIEKAVGGLREDRT